jgi:hypothetical protein
VPERRALPCAARTRWWPRSGGSPFGRPGTGEPRGPAPPWCWARPPARARHRPAGVVVVMIAGAAAAAAGARVRFAHALGGRSFGWTWRPRRRRVPGTFGSAGRPCRSAHRRGAVRAHPRVGRPSPSGEGLLVKSWTPPNRYECCAMCVCLPAARPERDARGPPTSSDRKGLLRPEEVQKVGEVGPAAHVQGGASGSLDSNPMSNPSVMLRLSSTDRCRWAAARRRWLGFPRRRFP